MLSAPPRCNLGICRSLLGDVDPAIEVLQLGVSIAGSSTHGIFIRYHPPVSRRSENVGSRLLSLLQNIKHLAMSAGKGAKIQAAGCDFALPDAGGLKL
jgi:hypothetical protein